MVLYNTTPDQARDLAADLATVTPDREVRISQLGPVIDTHIGPDVLGVAVKERLSE